MFKFYKPQDESGPAASGGQQQHQDKGTASHSPSSSSHVPPKTHTSATSSPAPLVCESALFGTRRLIATGCDSLSSIPRSISHAQIKTAFALLDVNRDGLVDVAELSEMLSNLGTPIADAVLSYIVASASKKGDHRISETEFIDWLALLIPISSGGNHDEPAGNLRRQQAAKAGGSFGSANKPATTTKRSKQQRLPRSKSSLAAAFATANELPSTIAAPQAHGSLSKRRGSGSGLALLRSLSSCGEIASSQSSSSSSSSLEKATVTAAQTSSSFSAAATSRKEKATKSDRLDEERQAADDARDDLRAAFCVFDLDGDGFITIDEVRAGLGLIGEQWTVKELDDVFRRKAAAGGKISVDDFVQFLL